MIMAGTRMRSQCANKTGRARLRPESVAILSLDFQDEEERVESPGTRGSREGGGREEGVPRTYTHHNKEPCAESSKIYYRIARRFHKIIWICAAPTDPVRKRGGDIGCNDE